MTVDAMSSLPMQAGSALAAAASRTALWALSAYMTAPLRNTAIASLVVVSAMAGTNLLYGQAHHHPAPLFGSFSAKPATKQSTGVAPAPKPKALVQKALTTDTTGSIPKPAAAAGMNNDDVKAVQQQLKAMALFTGTVDGLFGPRTSKAIRAFEVQIGRTPRGQLTPEVVALIKGAQLPASPPAPKAVTETPAAVVDTSDTTVKLAVAARAPAPVVKPLPVPAPLTASDAVAAPETQAVATDETTNSTGTEAVAMSTPSTVTKRTVPTIAVRASLAPAEASQDMPAALAATDETAQPAPTQQVAALETAAQPDTSGAPTDAAVADTSVTASTSGDPSMDPKVVTSVQRGLNSLGFLHGEITGEADEATAKAIRNFEVYYNYTVTGRVTTNLVKMLIQAGAVI